MYLAHYCQWKATVDRRQSGQIYTIYKSAFFKKYLLPNLSINATFALLQNSNDMRWHIFVSEIWAFYVLDPKKVRLKKNPCRNLWRENRQDRQTAIQSLMLPASLKIGPPTGQIILVLIPPVGVHHLSLSQCQVAFNKEENCFLCERPWWSVWSKRLCQKPGCRVSRSSS